MKQSHDLRRLLESIDHKSYPAYKDARGAYDFRDYILSIDHVQGDPFASPSKVSVTISHQAAGFPAALRKPPWRITFCAAFRARSRALILKPKAPARAA